MNKRAVGTKYEQEACGYLEKNGFTILEKNFRCRQGEIDIVGRHEGYLVFAEVKYRADYTSGTAAEAVTPAKQKRICRVADYYRYRHGISGDSPVRYDVVAIQGEADGSSSVCWYRNAFDHVFCRRS